ncbi:MAG: hypothetical protein IKC95_06390 [Oscillospiraceae bacterium]|nr:hypothetical protein [Oscillospiraceae bacterium]
MKILIMGFAKIKYMPYMNFYLDNIDKTRHEVHLSYWNRDLQEEDLTKYSDCTLHEFRCYQEDDVSKLSKISSFAKYRKFAKSVLTSEKFDFVFVLHTLTGVLVADVLKKRYAGKYIFDYRDSTYEGFVPYKKIVGDITRNAYATFVSSDAFRKFLPEDCQERIYTSHNLLLDSLNHRDEKEKNGIPSEKIRVAFWGFIRHEEINREIIKKLSQDERFELHYYGREQQVAMNLKAYAKELNATNIFFHGEYKPEDRYTFVRQTDIIHNVYKDANTMLAMGNKYYDGIVFRIPQICMPGSFMGECAEGAGVGFSVDPASDTFADDIYEKYANIAVPELNNNCDVALERVLQEYRDGIAVIKQSVNMQ